MLNGAGSYEYVLIPNVNKLNNDNWATDISHIRPCPHAEKSVQ